MFTGIVQGVGRVESFERNAFGARLVVDQSAVPFHGGNYVPGAGDSICVSGVCLTVVGEASSDKHLAFDVIKETLDKSKLGGLLVGSRVNLEPSVTPSQPLGGHFMQGHVDGVGKVAKVVDKPEEWRTRVAVPAGLMPYIVPKGSIAIDGVSLTIAAVREDSFEVALIPTTLELTTLRDLKVGDPINLEADIIAKTVVHHLRRMGEAPGSGGVTRALLEKAGMG